jgi:hypothetical protein
MKFTCHWTGPLTVIETLYNSVYKVKDDVTKLTFTANVSNLQPFTEPPFLVAQEDESQAPDSLMNEAEEDLPWSVEPDPLIHTPLSSPNPTLQEGTKRKREAKLEQSRQMKRADAKYHSKYLETLDSYGKYEVDEVISHRRL